MVGSVQDAVPIRIVAPCGVAIGWLAALSTAMARSPAVSAPGSCGFGATGGSNGRGGIASECSIHRPGARPGGHPGQPQLQGSISTGSIRRPRAMRPRPAPSLAARKKAALGLRTVPMRPDRLALAAC